MIAPDAGAAVLDRQRRAFLRDGAPSRQVRKDRLRRLRAAVLAHRAEISAAVSADFGHRSRHETELMELVPAIQAIDYLIRNLRRFMKPERRHVGITYRTGRAYVAYQPKGVVGVMAPWNYPVSLTLVPLATALAAGNRVLLKPSELTPRTSEVLQGLLAEAFSDEEVAVVLGGPDVGARFSALPFDHLLFTGSTAVRGCRRRGAGDAGGQHHPRHRQGLRGQGAGLR
ncbi:aldehyde dehydrogenase family protein [Microbacterium lacticum]